MMPQNPNSGLGRPKIDLANVVRIDDAELYFFLPMYLGFALHDRTTVLRLPDGCGRERGKSYHYIMFLQHRKS